MKTLKIRDLVPLKVVEDTQVYASNDKNFKGLKCVKLENKDRFEKFVIHEDLTLEKWDKLKDFKS